MALLCGRVYHGSVATAVTWECVEALKGNLKKIGMNLVGKLLDVSHIVYYIYTLCLLLSQPGSTLLASPRKTSFVFYSQSMFYHTGRDVCLNLFVLYLFASCSELSPKGHCTTWFIGNEFQMLRVNAYVPEGEI